MSKKELLAKTLDWSGFNRLARTTALWNGLIVLNYHRVGDSADTLFDHELWSASAEDFEQQVRFLSLNFELIGINDLDDLGHRHRGRHILITFDDGYRDNYEWAFPILKAYNSPATFFLTTGFLDERKVAWWDEISWMVRSATQSSLPENPWTTTAVSLNPDESNRSIKTLLNVFKKLSGEKTDDYLNYLAEKTGSGRCPQEIADQVWMTWDMVREMHEAGMDFGGHTVNHPILANHPEAQQRFEIEHCKQRIETEIGQSISAFSYPVGGRDCFDSRTRNCLQQAGYRWGFSYYGGFSRHDIHDQWDIPRIAIESEQPDTLFRASVSIPQVFC